MVSSQPPLTTERGVYSHWGWRGKWTFACLPFHLECFEFFVFAWLPINLKCFELDTVVWPDFARDFFCLFLMGTWHRGQRERKERKWSYSVVSDSFQPHGLTADQGPPSMEFSRQEYWGGLPFPFPGDLPDPGIKPRSPALRADALPSEPPGRPQGQREYVSFGILWEAGRLVGWRLFAWGWGHAQQLGLPPSIVGLFSLQRLPSLDWQQGSFEPCQDALTNDFSSPQFEPGECLLPVNPQGPADFSHYCKLLLSGALHLLLRCNQGFLTD